MRFRDKIGPLHHPIPKPADLPDFLAVARSRLSHTPPTVFSPRKCLLFRGKNLSFSRFSIETAKLGLGVIDGIVLQRLHQSVYLPAFLLPPTRLFFSVAQSGIGRLGWTLSRFALAGGQKDGQI